MITINPMTDKETCTNDSDDDSDKQPRSCYDNGGSCCRRRRSLKTANSNDETTWWCPDQGSSSISNRATVAAWQWWDSFSKMSGKAAPPPSSCHVPRPDRQRTSYTSAILSWFEQFSLKYCLLLLHPTTNICTVKLRRIIRQYHELKELCVQPWIVRISSSIVVLYSILFALSIIKVRICKLHCDQRYKFSNL